MALLCTLVFRNRNPQDALLEVKDRALFPQTIVKTIGTFHGTRGAALCLEQRLYAPVRLRTRLQL